jgi:hypothetical protein
VVKLTPRPCITAWSTREHKVGFAALAASRGLSESKLLGLIIDSVLARNIVEPVVKHPCDTPGRGDRITIRLRPGDGRLLRARAQERRMSFSTYAAALIRANLRAHPPMPLEELARLEHGVAQIRALGRSLSELARAVEGAQGVGPALRLELATVLQAVERLRQEMREVVKVNRISWESADAEAAP